ncbi:MMPL family transporter [Solirubrobacter ginsenosidimutans]|uniref:MMPL family transporter n=1 Tax=Solirubrobacter ginsenosidimutans TaxID=490573 RepID=A0A9X3N1A0_9ACTN|nr:MMPL family transporter [Solirubrobacter ginsenosidimutans]MDA0166569.1 MMPL family transporter [Solirubrobacter ginsenosidimutans]
MGRWSAQHRKKAIGGWLAFVIISFVIGGMVGVKAPKDDQTYVGDSGKAHQLVDAHSPKENTEQVIVKGSSATSPEVHRAVDQTLAAVRGTKDVYDVQSPYAKGNANQLSKDGKSVLVTFKLRGDETAAEKSVEPVIAAVEGVQKANPGVFVGQFGDASANKALSQAFADDFKKAETLSLPITLIILVLAFGALVAAGVPLLLGLSAVMAALGLVALPSQLVPLDDNTASIILLVGLAVGVDYTLFYLRREREERAKGVGHREAIHIAAATSGRAVLISGVTVIVAMAGMFLAGDQTFTALGVGAITVVLVAMIGSVTVVPAILSVLGDRVEKGRVPFIGRRRNAGGESRMWNAILDRVLKRPLISAIASVAVLLALASPALSMHAVLSGTDDLPRNLAVMKTYDKIDAAFPGGQIPAVVTIAGRDVTTPAVVAATKDLETRAVASGRFNGPVDVTVSADKKVAQIAIPIKGSGNDDISNAGLADLRDSLVGQTVGRADGVSQAYVAGMTAETKDYVDFLKGRAPLVVGFVLILAFLLLLVTFRSLVIPIKAIVLNLLSVGAAYGVLTWVFQDGHFENALSFSSNGGVTAWLPIFLFVILFGLSMDYHVFILSRVKEAVDRGMKTEDAVAHSIKATASTVTSAAVVMVAVFAIFATLSFIDFKEMGVGLAVAILIDATIVRAVLLPATMKLLGKWNWYLPSKLHWLPEFRHEGAVPEPAQA